MTNILYIHCLCCFRLYIAKIITIHVALKQLYMAKMIIVHVISKQFYLDKMTYIQIACTLMILGDVIKP